MSRAAPASLCLLMLGWLAVCAPVAEAQPPVACCLPSGACAELTEVACDAAAGFSYSTNSCDGVSCIGCCLRNDDPCQDNLSIAVCAQGGSVAFHTGAVCSDGSGNPGTCVDVLPAAAAPALGRPALAAIVVLLLAFGTRHLHARRRHTRG